MPETTIIKFRILIVTMHSLHTLTCSVCPVRAAGAIFLVSLLFSRLRRLQLAITRLRRVLASFPKIYYHSQETLGLGPWDFRSASGGPWDILKIPRSDLGIRRL